MKKISIIGHFAFGKEFLDGQTIKTKVITKELENQLGSDQVLKIDTHGGKKNLLKSPFQVIKALKTSANVMIFPAHNGVRVYAPLLLFFKRFFKNRKIYYNVIGGWLANFLENKKGLVKKLKKFDGLYVETSTMKTALEEMGFTNVSVMPNCKDLKVLSERELVYSKSQPFKLCTFSRVMKQKGVEDAVNAVIETNKHYGRTVYTLDIYGQVDGGETEWFENLKETFPEYIKYGGLVPFDKSVEVLKDYFALLFPTYYEGEGFAGTIIDAYSAGLPVIASDWKYNSEIVKENVGYIYPTRDQVALINILSKIAVNPSVIMDKKRDCLIESKKYATENVIREFISQIIDV